VLTFERYLEGLSGSWEALAVPHPDALVERGPGYVMARFPDPVLNNAVLLDRSRLDLLLRAYEGGCRCAVWAVDRDAGSAAALEHAGFRRDEVTTAMVLDLAAWEPDSSTTAMRERASADEVSALNGTAPTLLRGVPGLRAFLSDAGTSGLITIDVGDDVNVSWVCTAVEARRQGLARAVLDVALAGAVSRGMRSATLQATEIATGLYVRAGFVPVGRWQEWVR
jgi:ribosomal protein S18 acetylase RimI-like enzyme